MGENGNMSSGRGKNRLPLYLILGISVFLIIIISVVIGIKIGKGSIDTEGEKETIVKAEKDSDSSAGNSRLADTTPLSTDLLLAEHYRNLVEGMDMLNTDIVYFYNDKRQMTCKAVYYYNAVQPMYELNLYDWNERQENTRKGLQIYYSQNNGMLRADQDILWDYNKYDENSNLIYVKLQNGHEEYTYDDKGNVLTKSSYMELYNEGLFEIENYEYKFDQSDRITEMLQTITDTKINKSKTNKTNYIYDKGGKLVEKREYKYGYNEPVCYVYEYDESGHLIKMREGNLAMNVITAETTYEYVGKSSDTTEQGIEDQNLANIMSGVSSEIEPETALADDTFIESVELSTDESLETGITASYEGLTKESYAFFYVYEEPVEDYDYGMIVGEATIQFGDEASGHCNEYFDFKFTENFMGTGVGLEPCRIFSSIPDGSGHSITLEAHFEAFDEVNGNVLAVAVKIDDVYADTFYHTEVMDIINQ